MAQIGAIASESTNLTAGVDPTVVDHSFSRTFGKSGGADVASMSMSFDDFVDMVNPLEHIPVISSIYRAIAGETINPVSRIAGDTLYGGIMGLASAALSAAGAIGDEMVAANNNGQSATATVVATLFGNDDVQATQLAESSDAATETIATTQVASLQTPAVQSPILQVPPLPSSTTQTASSVVPAAGTESNATIALAGANSSGPGMPLDRSKLAYGGVMDSSMMASAQQNQTLALAMAGKQEIMQAQKNLRNSRFATAAPPSTPTSVAATLSDLPKAEPQTQAALQNLIKELQAQKTVNQYKNSAQSTPIPGGTLDLVN
jgi:hypothetical protein